MTMDIPIEKRFKVLCEIVRAQHFAWREAALTMAPHLDAKALTNKMWALVGVQTARAYLKGIDPAQPLALQVARCIARSSVCMGEEVEVEACEGDEAMVTHSHCPWFDWHKRLDLLDEDQPGCDTWFHTLAEQINKTLGVNIKIKTECTLPGGADCCRRRISVQSRDATT